MAVSTKDSIFAIRSTGMVFILGLMVVDMKVHFSTAKDMEKQGITSRMVRVEREYGILTKE